jgi:hypothetical protein
LKTPTLNRYLKRWGYDYPTLARESPALRLQARASPELGQFDLSPSDLKHIARPRSVDEAKGEPTLMLYSVVEDRSGVAYPAYHCTYGEDVQAALRFLFNAMAPKADERFPFHGRPLYLYADPGPVVRSQVFHQVMRYLGIEVQTHPPSGKGGRRTPARAKGKVERPFRTVKEFTREPLPLPRTRDRGRGQCVALQLLQRHAPPHRAALTPGGLGEEPAAVGSARDVELGALLHLRARARAAQGGRRCAGLGRRRPV